MVLLRDIKTTSSDRSHIFELWEDLPKKELSFGQCLNWDASLFSLILTILDMKAIFWDHIEIFADVVVAIITNIIISVLKLSARPPYWLGYFCLLGNNNLL